MTHKVVYNTCYGGYGLSKRGALWIYKRLPKHLQEQVDEDHEFSRTLQSIIADTLPRHHPLLIEMVETIGSEKASGSCARLEVKEVEGNIYRIDEYDGKESVHTPVNYEWVAITDSELS